MLPSSPQICARGAAHQIPPVHLEFDLADARRRPFAAETPDGSRFEPVPVLKAVTVPVEAAAFGVCAHASRRAAASRCIASSTMAAHVRFRERPRVVEPRQPPRDGALPTAKPLPIATWMRPSRCNRRSSARSSGQESRRYSGIRRTDRMNETTVLAPGGAIPSIDLVPSAPGRVPGRIARRMTGGASVLSPSQLRRLGLRSSLVSSTGGQHRTAGPVRTGAD